MHCDKYQLLCKYCSVLLAISFFYYFRFIFTKGKKKFNFLLLFSSSFVSVKSLLKRGRGNWK